MSRPRQVVVVTGMGGMGAAIARRIGTGATVIIADSDERLLEAEAGSLAATGYDVVSHVVDVSLKDSVEALAAEAAARGPVNAVVHTAGVSPVQAAVDAIIRVDLVGTALMLDAFGRVMNAGGAGVFISSMAGTMATLDPEFERATGLHPHRAPGRVAPAIPGAHRRPGDSLRRGQAGQPGPGPAGLAGLGTAWGTGEHHLSGHHLHGDGRF